MFSLLNPTSGIESIGRYESGRLSMPAASDAQIVGGQVPQSAPALYKGETIEDAARSLLTVRLKDQSLLLPGVWDAAFLETQDRMAANLKRKDTPTAADIFMRENNELRDSIRESTSALKHA